MRPATVVLAVTILAAGACSQQSHRTAQLVRAEVPTTTTSTTSSTTTTTAPPVTVPKAVSTTWPPAPKHTKAAQVVAPQGEDFWRRLANCESSHGADSGPYGGYFQMTDSSWANGGGTGGHAHGSYDDQKAVAQAHAAKSNPYQQWPVCWRRAGG